jgi:replicative DNA helicase
MKSLPAFTDIERMVLGWSLMRPANLDAARGSIEGDEFSLESHRRIWNRMSGMYDTGRAVDRITLYHELTAHGEAESVGGLAYLVDLENGLPETPCLDAYLNRLREASLRRRMIVQAQHLMDRAADETQSADEVLSAFAAVSIDLAKCTDQTRQPISTHDMIQAKGVDALLAPRRHAGIRLPWTKLDEALNGLNAGQMVVLMAATSRGKTSMALQVATSAAVRGHTPVIWTMEMSPESLFRRMVTQLGGAHVGKHTLTFEDREAQREAIARLDDKPIYFDRFSRNVGSFTASLRRIRSQRGVGLAIVDYLQLIRGTGRNRAQEVSDNSRALKLAAMDLQIPFLVLSQVDRSSVKGDGKIGLHSAKESGDVENDADVVLWIEAGELARDHETPVSIHIGKQREGPAGFSIPMVFSPTAQMFMEMQS